MFHINLKSFLRLIRKRPGDTVRACEWEALFTTLIKAHNELADSVSGILRGDVHNFRVHYDVDKLAGHPIGDFVLWPDLAQKKQYVTFKYPYDGVGYVIRTNNICFIQLWFHKVVNDGTFGTVCKVPDDCIPRNQITFSAIGQNKDAEDDPEGGHYSVPRLLGLYGHYMDVDGDTPSTAAGNITLRGNDIDQPFRDKEYVYMSATYIIDDPHETEVSE